MMDFNHNDRSEIKFMHQIDVAEAKENLGELIEAAINGEEVLISKDNEPVVKLVVLPTTKKLWPSKAGSAKGMVWMSDDFDEPLEDFKEYCDCDQSCYN
jgi:prevent-host-death family protein